MKRCSGCKEVKSLSDFGNNASAHDGLSCYCRACKRGKTAKWRADNLDKARALDREQKRKERVRKGPLAVAAEWRDWYQRNVEHRREYKRAHQDKVKVAAQNKLNKAIRAGRVTRPSHCSQCGKKCKPDAHHNDYALPLTVTWLCRKCHRALQH